MSSDSSVAKGIATESPWWREPGLLLVILFGIVAYGLRINDLPLYGEEPRRALIAREMIESGDWLVPGTQGVFLPSRPPLQNWLIALCALMQGSFDPWVVRLPSILSTITMAVIVYGYLRLHVGVLGSTAGAVSFLTMQLVLEFGRLAETEAVFTVFLAPSLLLWHWGWIKKWPASKMWAVGYGIAALGMLTKGLQAPVYFVGSTGLFLLATGNWRAIFTRGHLIGILTFVVTFGAWQGPFIWRRGIADSWSIYFADVAARFVDRSWNRFFTHLAIYPCELVFVRLMPWSVLLLAFCDRRVRERLGPHSQSLLFMTICILFSFVFVWLPPGSKVRYYMPLLPCFAVLVGFAVDGLAAIRRDLGRSTLWGNYVQTAVWVMIGVAIGSVGLSIVAPNLLISLPVFESFSFAFVAFGLAFIARKSFKSMTDGAMTVEVYSIATFVALIQIVLVTTVQQRRCEDIAGQVAEVRKKLPEGAKLVSVGLVHHAFAFFYEKPIPIVSADEKLPDGIEYFCLHTYDCDPPKLPYEWKQIAVVSCDRFKGLPVPKDRVFIGYYLPDQVAEESESAVVREKDVQPRGENTQ